MFVPQSDRMHKVGFYHGRDIFILGILGLYYFWLIRIFTKAV